MKIVKWLKTDVKLQTSHLWIVGLGIVVALGFVINCCVAPFYFPCVPIDSEQLILSASIIAGLGTARQFVLYKFKYLQNLQPPQDDTKKLAEDILREKLWVPCVGWALVFGFAVNMLVAPFFPDDIRMVEWSFLQSAIGIFLTISGTREASIYKKVDETHQEVMLAARKVSRRKNTSKPVTEDTTASKTD
ncbi:MAG: hypothetical protein IJ532_02410 [Alphaproteobacteria bacterium]|nr:hypothetical protein [Alphaproteobacteria bacterium]